MAEPLASQNWPEPQRGYPAVVADDVSVTFRVYEDRRPSLREVVANRFRPRPYREIRAVRNVSFVAHAGEAIGVVGHNGSGKSTLLTAMAGLLPVTSGTMSATAQPMLLGVTAALKPQLSGRRNIMLGGLALGMSRDELEERMDEILDFAGLLDFADIPLRMYSTGMRARLLFSVSTAVRPDILLIDEALSVGDRRFMKRTDQRIKELQAGAGTIFLVSHGTKPILDNCSRVLWLDQGRLVADGPAEEVVAAYEVESDRVAEIEEREREERRARRRADRIAKRRAQRRAEREAEWEPAGQGPGTSQNGGAAPAEPPQPVSSSGGDQSSASESA